MIIINALLYEIFLFSSDQSKREKQAKNYANIQSCFCSYLSPICEGTKLK